MILCNAIKTHKKCMFRCQNRREKRVRQIGREQPGKGAPKRKRNGCLKTKEKRVCKSRKRNWCVKVKEKEKRAAYLHEEMLDDEDEGHNLGHLVNVLLHVVRVLMKIKR